MMTTADIAVDLYEYRGWSIQRLPSLMKWMATHPVHAKVFYATDRAMIYDKINDFEDHD